MDGMVRYKRDLLQNNGSIFTAEMSSGPFFIEACARKLFPDEKKL